MSRTDTRSNIPTQLVSYETLTTSWKRSLLAANKSARTIETYLESVRQFGQLRDELRNRIKQEGWTSIGSMGQPVPHPLTRLLSQTERLIVQLESRCGLTPTDRTRLGVSEVRAMSSLDALNTKREARGEEWRRQADELRKQSEPGLQNDDSSDGS